MRIVTHGMIGLLSLLVAGCAFVHGFDKPSTEYRFERQQPLTISKEEAKSVRTIVVASPLSKNIDPYEVRYLAEKLQQSGRFKIIGPASFAAALEAEGVRDASLIAASDIALFAQKIGKRVAADAVLILTGENERTDVNLGDALLGKGGALATNRLRLYSSSSGAVVWEQVQHIRIDIGMFSARSVPKERLVEQQHEPLVANFLASF